MGHEDVTISSVSMLVLVSESPVPCLAVLYRSFPSVAGPFY